MGAAKLSLFHQPKGISKFDMTLTAVETETEIEFMVDYSTRLFTERSIREYMDAHRAIVRCVLRDLTVRLAQIRPLPEPQSAPRQAASPPVFAKLEDWSI